MEKRGGLKMGYTHYYQTLETYDKTDFLKVTTDFKKIIPVLEHLGVKLADGLGENTPIISPTEIIFNGIRNCGHTQRNLGITWASKTAKGVSKNDISTKLYEITKGSWFAGSTLETRVCGGDCSHETFSLEQKRKLDPRLDQHLEKTNPKLFFSFTKTAYKPYDLAVNVCLIIAKHYLKNDIKVSSDGEKNNWVEGMQICQKFLGYGEKFELDK